MGLSANIANPLADANWNDQLASVPDCSFFHTANWARVLHEAYGYRPVYATLSEKGSLLALVSTMEVRSMLTGRHGAALPFTDYCEPISAGENYLKAALEGITAYGKKAGWRYIEFRGDGYFSDAPPCSGYYYGHILDLSDGTETVANGMRDSTRRNIRKALRAGVKIETATTPAAMAEFYQLHCRTRRMHGLPPQPFIFFRTIQEHVIAEDLGVVVLASYKGEYISGAVFFHFNDRAFYKFGATNRDFQEFRAANLVIWEAIARYAEKGYRILCFGRTDTDAAGLRQFKHGWGAQERIIKYYRFDPSGKRFLGNSAPGRERGYGILSRIPLPLLRAAGRMLYRHMG